jgi:hypothetical protein
MFKLQLTRIERRKARLRRLRQNLPSQPNAQNHPSSEAEHGTLDPERHYYIGASETLSEHIGTFLQDHAGDPAVKVISFLHDCSL